MALPRIAAYWSPHLDCTSVPGSYAEHVCPDFRERFPWMLGHELDWHCIKCASWRTRGERKRKAPGDGPRAISRGCAEGEYPSPPHSALPLLVLLVRASDPDLMSES